MNFLYVNCVNKKRNESNQELVNKDVENPDHTCIAGRNVSGMTTLENYLQFFSKQKMDLLYERTIAFLGIYREIKAYIHPGT